MGFKIKKARGRRKKSLPPQGLTGIRHEERRAIEAFDRFLREEPWNLLQGEEILHLVPDEGTTLTARVAALMGHEGEIFGLAVYRSVEDYELYLETEGEPSGAGATASLGMTVIVHEPETVPREMRRIFDSYGARVLDDCYPAFGLMTASDVLPIAERDDARTLIAVLEGIAGLAAERGDELAAMPRWDERVSVAGIGSFRIQRDVDPVPAWFDEEVAERVASDLLSERAVAKAAQWARVNLPDVLAPRLRWPSSEPGRRLASIFVPWSVLWDGPAFGMDPVARRYLDAGAPGLDDDERELLEAAIDCKLSVYQIIDDGSPVPNVEDLIRDTALAVDPDDVARTGFNASLAELLLGIARTSKGNRIVAFHPTVMREGYTLSLRESFPSGIPLDDDEYWDQDERTRPQPSEDEMADFAFLMWLTHGALMALASERGMSEAELLESLAAFGEEDADWEDDWDDDDDDDDWDDDDGE